MSQHIREDEVEEVLKRLHARVSVNDIAAMTGRPPEEIDAILQEVRSDKAASRLRPFPGANRYYLRGVIVGAVMFGLIGFWFGRVIGMS